MSEQKQKLDQMLKQQKQEQVTVPKQDLQKAQSAVASAMRVLRSLESKSTEKELAEQKAERDEMREKLAPAIEAVEEKLAEAVALANAHREMVTEFMQVVERKMPLPPHMAKERDALFWRIRECARMLDAIDRGEAVLARAKNLMKSDRVVTADTWYEVNTLLRHELPTLGEFHHNLVSNLDLLNRYVEQLSGKEREVTTAWAERNVLPVPVDHVARPDDPRVVEVKRTRDNVRVTGIEERAPDRPNRPGETRVEM